MALYLCVSNSPLWVVRQKSPAPPLSSCVLSSLACSSQDPEPFVAARLERCVLLARCRFRRRALRFSLFLFGCSVQFVAAQKQLAEM
eukprot:1018602-Pleurochrysis_carterae.AAC.1